MFNILVGRDMQKSEGMEPQVAMCMPILEGTDGVQKMSKSLNNYIGVNESAAEMYGKVMSVSDELMARYYLLLLGTELGDGHPMEQKKSLAQQLTARYHSEEAAIAARENWDAMFSKRDSMLPIFLISNLGERRDLLGAVGEAFASIDEQRSGGQIRTLIQQGAIQLEGEKITDVKAEPEWADGQI